MNYLQHKITSRKQFSCQNNNNAIMLVWWWMHTALVAVVKILTTTNSVFNVINYITILVLFYVMISSSRNENIMEEIYWTTANWPADPTLITMKLLFTRLRSVWTSISIIKKMVRISEQQSQAIIVHKMFIF